jgi:hydrogenase-4 transcriptional activator
MRVAGRAATIDNPGAAHTYFNRSIEVSRAVGNHAACAGVEFDSRSIPTKPVEHDSRPPIANITERIAWLANLGTQPALLAAEAFSLLIESSAARYVQIVAVQTDGGIEALSTYHAPESSALPDAPSDEMRLSVGSLRETSYELVVLPHPTSTARFTVHAVEQLLRWAHGLARSRQVDREQASLWPDQTPEQQLGLICASERMLDLVKTIRRVAGSNLSVLLTGETGVGKELFARALHQASTRSEKVFLPFNCTAVPREMFDSQLFGHRRGSFTGAIDDSPGVIRAAAGGTLFLDEIGEMSLDTQPKLLRFLESGEIRPLGDPRPQLVDVRIVAATNAHLDRLVADGQFREDLYYRLNVIRINIPPLRERREEIPALVEHFLDRYGRELQKPQLRVADETLEYLVLYRWPGNVRQLANEIRRIVALAESGAVLMPAHLSDDIAASRKTIPTERPALQSTEVMTRLDQPLSAALEHIERAAIQRALALAEGNLVEAARMLGLSRKGLYLKRQRLGLA